MAIYDRYAEVYDDSGQIGFSLRMIPYLDQVLAIHHIVVDSALDLACGTGTMALSFAAKSWESYAVDLSPTMLALARQKAETMGVMVAFSQQDMRSFILPHPVSLITCLYDSLNYLLSLDDLRRTFRQAANALQSGGYFLFDMNTPWFLEYGWDNNTFYVDGDKVCVATLSGYDKQTGQATATIICFVKRGEFYEKFVERHTERGYTIEEIGGAIAASGLETVAIYRCFTFDPPAAESPRNFWVTRRPHTPAGKAGR